MRFRFILFAILFGFSSNTISAQKFDVNESDKTIEEFKEQDSDISKFFETAYGYAVLYSVGKGAIGIGGAGGKGTVYQGGTALADVHMTQITIGFQLGGQKYAEVIFFKDKETYGRFIDGSYEFAAQASAVALSSGASADAKYREGVLVFTMAIGGLMYEASIGGQKFKITMFE